MKKILFYLFFISFNMTTANATQTPAANISVVPSAFVNCLSSSDTNVQTALNDIDTCFGTLAGGFWSELGSNIYNNNTGNVGINSATPGASLDVQGTVRMTGFRLTTNPSAGEVLTSTSTGIGVWLPAPATGITNIATTSPIIGGPITSTGTIGINQSTTSTDGYLSSTDWNTFNGKQASGNYLTALTGDGTASGPGSSALTLATVNVNTGSWGSSIAIPNFTVNGKGLLTAAGTNAVIAPAGTLTGTTLASNVVTSSLTTVGTIGTGGWQGTPIAYQYGGLGLNTAPVDDLAVGNGSGWTLTNVNSCSGATSALTYNTTTHAFGCNTISGGVTSVSNSDVSLTITPTTGAVVASLNTAHGNTWTGQQIFNTANVGINSATPGKTLDVQGTVRSIGQNLSGVTVSKVLVTDSNHNVTSASNIQDLAYCQTGGTNCPGSITGFANPSATIGLTVNNGSATTAMRSDATPALGVTISPTWTGNHIFAPSSGNTLFSQGNVGIGSANPGKQLDVQGTLRTTGFILSTSPTSGYVLTSNGVGIGTWAPASSGGSSQWTGTVPGDIYYNSGNVGIGTFNTSGGTLYVEGISTVVGQFTVTNSSGHQNMNVTTSGEVNTNNNTLDDGSGNMSLGGNVGIGTTLTTTSALTVMNGNVGIGTWVPSQMLQINGGVNIYGVNPLYFGQDKNSLIVASQNTSADLLIVNNTSQAVATGTYTVMSVGGNSIYTFTGGGTFTPLFSGNVNVLVIGGGAGGGSTSAGGGGGAGGYQSNISYSVTSNTPINITVGAAGAVSSNGGNTTFGTITAIGGGTGGNGGAGIQSGANGGSGGGGGGFNGTFSPGTPPGGTGSQGGNGGAGAGNQPSQYGAGGGGGAGGAGSGGSSSSGGTGGVGIANSISGSSITYSVGGNGGDASGAGSSGGSSYGSGGGGAGQNGSSGTSGIQGVVIISFPNTIANENSRFSTTGNFLVGIKTPSLSGAGNIEASGTIKAGTLTVSNITASGNVGINSTIPGQRLDVQGTVRATSFTGLGIVPSGTAFQVPYYASAGTTLSGSSNITATGTNVGIGSVTPGQALDVQGTIRFTNSLLNTKSSTGIGWSEHNATNQACNTTCGTSACVVGLDIGTVGVVNSGFVACTDATADDCLCAGP